MPKRGAKLFPPLPQFLKVGRAISFENMYQTNKEYIFCINFIKMYTECNEHHLN
jgi:hypothetical protein